MTRPSNQFHYSNSAGSKTRYQAFDAHLNRFASSIGAGDNLNVCITHKGMELEKLKYMANLSTYVVFSVIADITHARLADFPHVVFTIYVAYS